MSGSQRTSGISKAGGITIEDLDQTDYNDEAQSHQLPHREDILDPGGHADAGAVHPGQQHWAAAHNFIRNTLRTQERVLTSVWISENMLKLFYKNYHLILRERLFLDMNFPQTFGLLHKALWKMKVYDSSLLYTLIRLLRVPPVTCLHLYWLRCSCSGHCSAEPSLGWESKDDEC